MLRPALVVSAVMAGPEVNQVNMTILSLKDSVEGVEELVPLMRVVK